MNLHSPSRIAKITMCREMIGLETCSATNQSSCSRY